jgi:hypothetical protein
LYDLLTAAESANRISGKKTVLSQLTNNDVFTNMHRNDIADCLELIKLNRPQFSGDTLTTLTFSENLLWNAIVGWMPKSCHKTSTFWTNILSRPGAPGSYEMRGNIGSALIFFCFFDNGANYVLRSPRTLLPAIRKYLKTSKMGGLTKDEIDSFIVHYQIRMGLGDCFIVGGSFIENEHGQIEPDQLTPDEVAQKYKEQ